MADVVERTARAWIMPYSYPVWADWRYTTDHPWSVFVCFRDREDDHDTYSPWEFGRDLLYQGLTVPTGLGDVQVWPERGRIAVRLRNGFHETVLHFRHIDLRDFIAETFQLVPPGEECLPEEAVDEAVVRLLATGGEVR